MFSTFWFGSFPVSTLVLMDCHIWPGNIRDQPARRDVSTLVLMDCHIWRRKKHQSRSLPRSFNPCFNGLSYLTKPRHMGAQVGAGFNPCFNGLSYLTGPAALDGYLDKVSTLVLMDCHIWLPARFFGLPYFCVSTLVLMDCHIWLYLAARGEKRVWVSTLVLMDCHIWLCPAGGGDRRRVFQPLF